MSLHDYAFRSEWHIDANAFVTYQALEDVDNYPLWWKQVRAIIHLDVKTYEIVVRSLLPYDLSVLTTQSRRDPTAGVLEAHMTGDLQGFSRWTVLDDGRKSIAVFEEQVVAQKPLLRRLAFIARPLFQANHSVMMRSGQAGLSKYLTHGKPRDQ